VIEPVAAGELYPGSPAVNAVRLTVTEFGDPGVSDAGFDTSPNRFTMNAGQPYGAKVFLRSGNADMSPQTVLMQLPIFDGGGAFTGSAGSATVQATGSWAEFEIPPEITNLSGASAELSFRLIGGGAENSVQIALPRVTGPSLDNQVPNPGFSGSGGGVQENVSGDVPDFWRAFALDSEGASLSLQTVPVAAGELYPGSPPMTAMRVSGSDFTGAGFDHESTQVPLAPAGRLVWAEVFLRADNADNSDQVVSVSVPIFESDGTFTGTAPGTVNATATPEWKYFAGPSFSGTAGQTFNLSFRFIDSGAENSVLIAMPALRNISERVFTSAFEGDEPRN
jgi:hypothetical protein